VAVSSTCHLSGSEPANIMIWVFSRCFWKFIQQSLRMQIVSNCLRKCFGQIVLYG
jgi:hypothetical protein